LGIVAARGHSQTSGSQVSGISFSAVYQPEKYLMVPVEALVLEVMDVPLRWS
jgi:hypothetical protein